MFSATPLDQAHEQNNAKVNYSGGAVGSTENPVGLKIWMVSGPEQARLLVEFERHYSTNDLRIHEKGLSTQQWIKPQPIQPVDHLKSSS